MVTLVVLGSLGDYFTLPYNSNEIILRIAIFFLNNSHFEVPYYSSISLNPEFWHYFYVYFDVFAFQFVAVLMPLFWYVYIFGSTSECIMEYFSLFLIEVFTYTI